MYQQSTSRIWINFLAEKDLARDEIHHQVFCVLDVGVVVLTLTHRYNAVRGHRTGSNNSVPHLGCLSRPCRGRPPPCSHRLPAAGALFVFEVRTSNCLSVRVYRNSSGM